MLQKIAEKNVKQWLFDHKTVRLVPTQKELGYRALNKYFYDYLNGKEEKIPKFPVRENPENPYEYLILDGHHRAIIADLFGKTPRYFKVYSPKDKITDQEVDEDSKEAMNCHIQGRWNEVVSEKCFLENNPRTIQEFRAKYDFLKNVETAEKYFKENKAKLKIVMNENLVYKQV